MHPDASVLVPLAILFISALNGPSIKEAFSQALSLFISPGPGIVFWSQVILLNFLIYIYLAPVFRVHMQCLKGCDLPQNLADLAMCRLNRSNGYIIRISTAVFLLGRVAMLLVEHKAGDAGRTTWQGLLLLAESLVSGYFVGVILSLQFEDRLHVARETVLSHNPQVPMKYSSLSFKMFLVTSSIVAFMTIQSFTIAGGFLATGIPDLSLPHSIPKTGFFSGPDLIFQANRFSAFKNIINLSLIKLLILSAFAGQMIFKLKRLIDRPIVTIMGRLKTLNAQGDQPVDCIPIIKNDEFAEIFKQVNTLIERQKGRLELSRQQLDDLVAGAADPIIAYDRAGTLRLLNPAAERTFGCRREEALGKNLSLLLGDAAKRFKAAHANGLARFEWIRSDGVKILMESHLSGSQDEGDGWTTVILRDIAKQAELEKTLQTARQEAENANRMKSEFLANMSHELRTPLNAILGFTQLLGNDRNLTDPQRDKIRIVSRSGEHLLSLINDILDISKIEAGKMELHSGVFDLLEFTGDLKDMFELKCRTKGLSFYLDILDGLPRYVSGDIGKLRQVLVNLLGNAVKFTAEGGVGILVGMDGDNVRFSVRDTGRGIPKEEQHLLMQPFVQASTTDHEGGTGLGLAISSHYVSMMGGTLSVESSLGSGSVFSFSLPLKPSAEAPSRRDDEDILIELAGSKEIVALVVDDQEANRLVLKEMLEHVGFSVIEAKNGREAVDSAAETGPSLVFMDIKMPVMDGYAAVGEIKKLPEGRCGKVFALTASAFNHDEAKIIAAGFDGFLAKPFKQGNLYRLILERSGLEVRRIASEKAEAAPLTEPLSADYAAAADALAPEGIAHLIEAAFINDFSSISALAREIEGKAAIFSRALGSAAASFDEGRIAVLLQGLGTGEKKI